MSDVPTTKIWIVRRGNGKAQVHPSPAVLKPGGSFGIHNLTREEVFVAFPPDTIEPDGEMPVASKGPGPFNSIPPGGIAVYHVVARTAQFFEYKVTLPAVDQYAEGGSKPGVIIDP